MSTEMDQGEEAAKWFDLNPDRHLLDANFEGYKLSLDTFPQYKLDLTDQYALDTYHYGNDDVKNENHNQKMLLFQHLKLIGLQNLLIVNQFNDSNVYYFDAKFRLVKVNYKSPGTSKAIYPTNLQLNLASSSLNRVNVTMKFISATKAIVFDGYETIYMFEVVELDGTEKWTEVFSFPTKNLEKFGIACILKDAVLLESGQLHLLFMNVQTVANEDKRASYAFDTLINWLMFEEDRSINIWNLKRVRRLNCSKSVPDYVALETNGQSVYIAGPGYIKYEFDSVKSVQLPKVEDLKVGDAEEKSEIEKFYTWNQTVSDVTLNVCILETGELEKGDLAIKIESDTLEITHRGRPIINDRLFNLIKPGESTWTLDSASHMIEFSLAKAQNEIWPVCLKDMHMYGEYRQDEVKDSDLPMDVDANKKISWEETQTLYRLDQQLEECDAIDDTMNNYSEKGDDLLMFRRMDGDTHCATHKTFINDTKFLFDVKLSPHKNPALCLRHDIDGILWQPHRITDTPSTETIWMTHLHTFLAFGYVQASKQNTKFRSCPPDCSYVCIADTNKHIYVYKSVAAVTQLKNRKSGRLVPNLAKQYLISLETDEEIYGLYCANDYLLVLQGRACYVYHVNN